LKILLRQLFLSLLILLLEVAAGGVTLGQIVISGTVYDSSKLYVIPGVDVSSTSGIHTVTDSLGAYHIPVSADDSISFFYRGKSTMKFAVRSIQDYNEFDISLRVRVRQNYKLLQGVTVYSDNYQLDSVQNRLEYQKTFDFRKPGIRPSFDGNGPPGLDIDALVSVFNFRKNREELAFQKRLIDEEHDDYVNYRFSAELIHRITGLSGDSLQKYRKLYRPTYNFVVNSTLVEFYQYILDTSYEFKREEGITK
jgi:hypothetical protein